MHWKDMKGQTVDEIRTRLRQLEGTKDAITPTTASTTPYLLVLCVQGQSPRGQLAVHRA